MDSFETEVARIHRRHLLKKLLLWAFVFANLVVGAIAGELIS